MTLVIGKIEELKDSRTPTERYLENRKASNTDSYQQACIDIIKILEDAGMGKSGKPNTIRDMVREIIEERDTLLQRIHNLEAALYDYEKEQYG